jgi:predicted metal-dependent peptidase
LKQEITKMSQFADVERLMIKARTALILNPKFVFFGTLALRLKMVPTPATETADCDGITIRYNPDFVRKLTHDQRVGLIAHETMHAAAGHPFRLGAREHERFNEACDYVINQIITDAGVTLPDGALLDAQYKGMAAEEVYAKLPPKPQGGGAGKGKAGNVGGCGVFSAPTDPNDPQQNPMPKDQQQQLARDWQIATMQAASVARRAEPGSVPGSAEEMIDAMRRSRVDWREALKRFLTERADEDYDWSRPNRRFVSQGIYLPSLYSEKCGAIGFFIDTSISMDTRALEQALAELNMIVEEMRPETVHVIECDTEVGWEADFTPADFPIKSKTLHGRGGTAFSPVFRRVAERGLELACAIYFTDLDCLDFGDEPPYPVLWASTLKTKAPFGEVIRVLD